AASVSHPVIIIRHVMPNIIGPIVVVFTLWISTAIRLEATLSFLGLGTQPPEPSWGNIIRDGLDNMFGSPWPIIGAGIAISLTVLGFNMIGDAVRDVLQLPADEMPAIRGKDIAMIFQEPMSSLNPVMTIGDQIGEAIMLHEPLV